MMFNGVDIYTCKFFALNQDRKLAFIGGKHKGKIPNDFNTPEDIHRVTSYCYWIINNKEIPLVSKYCALAFLKELNSKIIELERLVREKAIKHQEEMKIKTEESAKETGKKYI